MAARHNVNGFKFRPLDPDHLAERLVELSGIDANRFNAVVEGGRNTVEETYSAREMLRRYRQLFEA